MSVFSFPDAVDDPSRLVAYLDVRAQAASRMKYYAAVAHALRRPDGVVLDLGCGAGHDLAILASVGVRTVGIDLGVNLLRAARDRAVPTEGLVQAVGEALPFPDGSLAGCRIERVLMHVVDPSAVLAEVARCLRPGALLTVFEPDWERLLVRTECGDVAATWLTNVRHPGIGGALWSLVETEHFEVLDRVEELSVLRNLSVLDDVTGGLARALDRASVGGRIRRTDADDWMHEQQGRDERGEFYATIPKVLVVALLAEKRLA